MNEKTEKLKYVVYIIIALLGGAVLLYGFVKYIFVFILPFLLGWGMAFCMRPIANFISKKTHIPRPPLRLILTVLTTSVVLTSAFFGIWKLSQEVWKFLQGIGEGEGLHGFLTEIMGSDGIFGGAFRNLGENVADVLYRVAVSLLTSLANVISEGVKAVPKVFLFILVTVISSIYFSLDLDRINSTLRKVLPKSVYNHLVSFKNSCISFCGKYLKSYLILMAVTFVIMQIGLLILHVPYSFLLSILISVLDLLPIIGVGTILVPWSIFAFIGGNNYLSLGLIILFLVNEVIREFLEPKLLGRHLGVHPIITLFLLYIGYSLFGFLGLVTLPIGMLLIGIALGKYNTSKVLNKGGGEGDDI